MKNNMAYGRRSGGLRAELTEQSISLGTNNMNIPTPTVNDLVIMATMQNFIDEEACGYFCALYDLFPKDHVDKAETLYQDIYNSMFHVPTFKQATTPMILYPYCGC